MKTKEAPERGEMGREADRAWEACALWAESGQAIFRQGAELAVKAVEEATRLVAAFQAAGVEAARDAQAWTQRVIREGLEEGRRAAQGLQTAGDQAAMQVRAVLSETADKVKDLYTPAKS